MCNVLKPLWDKLWRSKAPTAQKLAVLPVKVWSGLLHGAAACVLSDARVTSLRASATKALRIHPAGSSSSLRLVLSPDMRADPGFFQFWTLLCDLRRICRKQPSFLESWISFVRDYNGRASTGPFSSLLRLCSRLGWHVEPPFLSTSEGIRFDLLKAPSGLLRLLAEQSWGNFVVRQHRHRQTMRDLASIDLDLLRLDAKQISACDTARVQVLQSGASIANAQHAKYDHTKHAVCPVCDEPDTVEHKIRFCRKFTSCRQGYQGVLEQWDELPKCLSHHLLVPLNPFVHELAERLESLQPPQAFEVGNWHFQCWHDLFTDGTLMLSGRLSLVAWAVVSATAGRTIEAGPLPGVWQTVPRAELQAALFFFSGRLEIVLVWLFGPTLPTWCKACTGF